MDNTSLDTKMQIEFTETENSVSFILKPETVADFAKLARFAANAKAQKPYIDLSYYNDDVWMAIYMNKVSTTKRITRICPKHQK